MIGFEGATEIGFFGKRDGAVNVAAWAAVFCFATETIGLSGIFQ